MGYYRVEINAKNFLVEMEGEVAKHGFITVRFVEADDPDAAELKAVQMLRDDRELRPLVKNEPGDPPEMEVMEMAELDSFDGVEQPTGRLWVPMNPKRWWQFWRK